MAISNRDIQALFFATQTGKGVEATAFKKAAHVGSVTTNLVKAEVEVDPDLGNGYHNQESYNGEVYGTTQVSGIATTGIWLSHALSSFMKRVTTVGTGGLAGSFQHIFTDYNHNPDRPWLSTGLIYAPGSTLGTGVVREIKTDVKVTGFTYKSSPKTTPAYTLDMTNLQEGPGASGLTFTYDPDFNMPVVANPAGNPYPLVVPSFFPAAGTFCITDKSCMMKADVKMAGPCENGAYQDILFEKVWWEGEITTLWDSLTDAIVRYHRYMTTTPGATAQAYKTGFAKGPLRWQESSMAVIPSTTIHESVTWDFPQLMWTDVQIDSSQSPVAVKLKYKTFGNVHNITAINGKSDANMTF